VNIARIFLSRDAARGKAFALYNVDAPPPPELLEELRRLKHMRVVRALAL
jgi:(S)-sulfolactate dehydrogenase